MSIPIPSSGRSDPSTIQVRRGRVERLGHQVVDRQDELPFASGLRICRASSSLSASTRLLPVECPWALRKSIGHRPADEELLDPGQQVLDDADLVGHLGPAHHGDHRRLGVLQQGVEDLQFLLDEEADRAGLGA